MTEIQPAPIAGEELNPTFARSLALYDPDLDFKRLASQAMLYTRGYRLIDKAELAGVPHVIIGVTYREGYLATTGPYSGEVGDYISVEAVVADKDTLALPQFQGIGEMTVFPNEPVVYNDGGTGIRRSMTMLLNQLGIINVGAAPKLKDGTSYSEFDKPYQKWAEGAANALAGITQEREGVPFRYVATRGLRRSDYVSPYGDATTWYFG